jgi:AMP nucleosidase
MLKSSVSPKPSFFKKPEDALKKAVAIYDAEIAHLRAGFQKFTDGKLKVKEKLSGHYPYIRITLTAEQARRVDSRHAYGFVPRAGVYMTTITRPDIFYDYYLEQLNLLTQNHGAEIEVGRSTTAMPIHFALGENYHLEKAMTAEQALDMPFLFDVPDLELLDDEIANGTETFKKNKPGPLSLFTAPRVDLSLHRLKHYCGTSPHHFQHFVIFTNYQFYIDGFIKLCLEMMEPAKNAAQKKEREQYVSFVQPGDRITLNANVKGHKDFESINNAPIRLPQMPAYHLKMKNGAGITMVNIGVGPSNAKTITDHIAVLRPHAWLMLGHCAGLRNSQRLGDYVLAHGYLREDNILDEEVPLSIPIPALSEIQLALEAAVSKVSGKKDFELKAIMRTGTVATTADRNWELRPFNRQNRRLSQSRAIAMDMESGTIAANGFRFRVPYGTLLCVSDKPLHGQLKLPGMADAFYRERVEQHLKIGLLTMTMLRDLEPEKLHSRKLRSFNEVAFR